MTRISDETRRKVVRAHIQDGRTIAGFAVEYGISGATVSNWVRSYRSTVKCYVQLCLHPLIQ